ncbi:MAG: hypothetical protein OXH11_09665 [Candidatus Aminicenantes bacterium]|nr:hypothetical protein [Candidatus Aminicenantes bacterium]
MKRNGFTKEIRYPFKYRYGKVRWAGILLMEYLYPTLGVPYPILE